MKWFVILKCIYAYNRVCVKCVNDNIVVCWGAYVCVNSTLFSPYLKLFYALVYLINMQMYRYFPVNLLTDYQKLVV